MANELFGFTTADNKFDSKTDYNIAVEDVLNELNTDVGDCDWDVNLGSSIRKKLFSIKNDIARQEIQNEITAILEKHYFSVYKSYYTEYEKGWEFTFMVRWLGTIPLEWKLKTVDNKPYLYSIGVFPLKG